MFLVGLWHGGLGNQAVEDMANVNLNVLCFLGLAWEDDVPDQSVLSRFRTKLTKADAWDGLLSGINWQIEERNLMVKSGCHVDVSITHSPRKLKAKPNYEIVGDREERDDEANANADMRVVEVTQPGVDSVARCLKKGGKSIFANKQHTVVDGNGLVIAAETTTANRHDSQPLVDLVDKAGIEPGRRLHVDKAYCSKKHQDTLKYGTSKRYSGQGRQEQTPQSKTCPQQDNQRNKLCG